MKMPKHQSLSHKQMAANDEVKQAVVQAVAVESVERIVNAPVEQEIAERFEEAVLEMIATEAPKKTKKRNKSATKTTEE
jgi:hypothetical protein